MGEFFEPHPGVALLSVGQRVDSVLDSGDALGHRSTADALVAGQVCSATGDEKRGKIQCVFV